MKKITFLIACTMLTSLLIPSVSRAYYYNYASFSAQGIGGALRYGQTRAPLFYITITNTSPDSFTVTKIITGFARKNVRLENVELQLNNLGIGSVSSLVNYGVPLNGQNTTLQEALLYSYAPVQLATPLTFAAGEAKTFTVIGDIHSVAADTYAGSINLKMINNFVGSEGDVLSFSNQNLQVLANFNGPTIYLAPQAPAPTPEIVPPVPSPIVSDYNNLPDQISRLIKSGSNLDEFIKYRKTKKNSKDQIYAMSKYTLPLVGKEKITLLQKYAINNFIVYGIPAFQPHSAKQRRDFIYTFKMKHNRVPVSAADWTEVCN